MREFLPVTMIPGKLSKSFPKSSSAVASSTPMPMTLHPDIHDFIELCLSQKVEFLLVGGYALA